MFKLRDGLKEAERVLWTVKLDREPIYQKRESEAASRV